MTCVLINATASTAGGGRTYLSNVIPRLARLAPPEMSFHVMVPAVHLDDYRTGDDKRVSIEGVSTRGGLEIGRAHV